MKNSAFPGMVTLEHPLFGQFVRQVASVPCDEIQACLQTQQDGGGHLGEILCARGVLSEAQCQECLRLQAAWVANAMRAEVAPARFPYPTFLSVCLPAYNEEQNIRSTIEAACTVLPVFVEQFEIVVVDDGSVDRTADLVQAFEHRGEQVQLVRHDRNRGYGAAVTSGMRAAKGDLVMFMDSDGQFNLLDLPRFLGGIAENDMVVGYRAQRTDSALRWFNGWAWTGLINAMFQVGVRDLDCAFKLFRREVLDTIELDTESQAFNAQLMAECVSHGFRIAELPVMHYPRRHGEQTGGNLRNIANAFIELWHIRARNRGAPRGQSPIPLPPSTARVAEHPSI